MTTFRTRASSPSPKVSTDSDWAMKPRAGATVCVNTRRGVWTSTRAPPASGWLRVATSCSRSQGRPARWSLRRRMGEPLFCAMTTSGSPSPSKSPIATPRMVSRRAQGSVASAATDSQSLLRCHRTAGARAKSRPASN